MNGGHDADEMAGMQQMVAGGNANARKLELVQKGKATLGPVLASDGLAEFSRMLSVFTHCSKLKVYPVLTCRHYFLCC